MTKPQPKTKRRWGKLVLFVSLALNLVVIGLVVGALLGGHNSRPPPLGVWGYISAMTKEQRRDFLAGSDHKMGGQFKVINRLNRGQSGILGVIATEPFDAEALLLAMKQQRDQLSSVTEGFQRGLAVALADMSKEERALFVERYKKRGRDRWSKPRH